LSDNPYRLPRTVLPVRYDLRIEPDLDTFTFSGEEAITVDVHRPTDEVVLNACELEIDRATVDGMEAEVSYQPESQRATLRLPRRLEAGPNRIEMSFRGILNDQLQGFYRSTFTDVDGNTRLIATTQFEATDARRAFPCFDEPDLKAVFSVTLVVPEDLMAISNTREVERTPVGDGKVAVRFADTIRMSTYLVAFVVGPFEATDPVEVDGVPIRVVTPPGKLGLTGFALGAARFSLRYLTDYYGIPYPGDKLDLVAIPDFAFGAMENLGCVTFREAALLLDPETAGQAERQRVLDVVAHELAHMWFGDLVTMRWWDGIWLNEAFASFMEMKAADAMRPDWKRWLAFAAVDRPWAYRVDALRSTRPVEFVVTSPEEANEMFDALTYGKGSSVLRMLEQFLGEETFRRGIETYLRTHEYDNTVTDDLWDALEDASGLPVGQVMDTWIHERGFPWVSLGVEDGRLVLSQRRFLALGGDDPTLWSIPLQIRGETDDGPFEIRHLLDSREIRLELPGEPRWVVANAGGHGYYRVGYPEDWRTALTDRLDRLAPIERFCLVDDLWAFAEAGTVPVVGYLQTLGSYRTEEEHAVWQTIAEGLASVWHHLVADEAEAGFSKLVDDLTDPMHRRLGWEPTPGEADLVRRLRGLLLTLRGRFAGLPETVDRLRSLADSWLDDHRSVDPDVAQAAVSTLAAHGGENEYDRLFAAYQREDDPQLKLRLLRALTLVDHPEQAAATLDAITEGRIRNQDSAWVVAALLSLRRSGTEVWRMVVKRWDELKAAMPPMTIRRLPEGLPALSDPDTATQVKEFFADRELPEAAKVLQQNLERLEVNVALRLRERGPVNAYLREFGSG
jgi:puromycin-sensitive aminopeptidase